jgi:hypothetical protein
MPGIGAFQMTVGKAHTIRNEVTVDITNLGIGGNRLFCLLSLMYFDSFTKKKLQILQYAILIPYPETVDEWWDEDTDMEDGD